MGYRGKVVHEREFAIGFFVVKLDPRGQLGVRLKSSRLGFTWWSLPDLLVPGNIVSNPPEGQDPLQQTLLGPEYEAQ